MTKNRRKATIDKQDGPLHIKLTDDTGEVHWMMPGQFDPGAPTQPGSQVTIEYRSNHSMGLWHVLKGKATK